MKFAVLQQTSGLIVFSPDDVTEMAELGAGKLTEFPDSLTSTLLVSLMTAVVKMYSNKNQADIGTTVGRQLDILTSAFFPPLPPLNPAGFDLRRLMDRRYMSYADIVAQYPDLLYEGFSFLLQTMNRYSYLWTADMIQRWMTAVLQAIGDPDGLGTAFRGAIDFLVCHLILSADVRRIS